MKSLFVVVLIIFLAQFSEIHASSFPGNLPTRPLYDSAHAVIVDAKIEQGILHSKIADPSWAKRSIEGQLYFLVGQLNGHDGVVEMSQAEIEVKSVTLQENGEFEIFYTANLLLAWPREVPIPDTFQALLPLHGDDQGQLDFFKKYGGKSAADSNCMDWSAHDVSYDIFWYYYRPENYGCVLSDPNHEHKEDLASFELSMRLSDKNTSNKAPEYFKIWEDGKLEVLVMIALDKGDNPTPSDVGLSSYKTLHRDMFLKFGQPTESTLPQDKEPTLKDTALFYRWELADGKELIIRAYLIPGIRAYNPEFSVQYNQHTQTADLVAYNGHSGLGANIRALARLGTFVKGQYQIYFVNGCDTFAYLDKALTKAHEVVNPGENGTKYLDLIMNAMPAYFHHMSLSTLHLTKSLLEAKLNYRQILSGVPQVQRAVVSGEEDNETEL